MKKRITITRCERHAFPPPYHRTPHRHFAAALFNHMTNCCSAVEPSLAFASMSYRCELSYSSPMIRWGMRPYAASNRVSRVARGIEKRIGFADFGTAPTSLFLTPTAGWKLSPERSRLEAMGVTMLEEPWQNPTESCDAIDPKGQRFSD
jgi:hypothetical protein